MCADFALEMVLFNKSWIVQGAENRESAFPHSPDEDENPTTITSHFEIPAPHPPEEREPIGPGANSTSGQGNSSARNGVACETTCDKNHCNMTVVMNAHSA